MHQLQGHYSIKNLELTIKYVRDMYQNVKGGFKFEFMSKLGNTCNAYGAISNT